jgi:hypothetical protein
MDRFKGSGEIVDWRAVPDRGMPIAALYATLTVPL